MAESIDENDKARVSRRTQSKRKENANPPKNITKRRTVKNLGSKIVEQLNADEAENNFNLNEEEIDYEQTCKEQFDNLVRNKLKCSTLTKRELDILFLKYKFDQHYKPSETFAAYFNKQGMENKKSCYNEFPDVQQRPGNSFDSFNQTQYVQDNAKYISQENRKENQYQYFDDHYNYSNHIYKNYEAQSYTGINDTRSFTYSHDKIHTPDQYHSCSLMNSINTSSSSYGHGDKIVLHDLSNLNQQCENAQKDDTHLSLYQYNNYTMNQSYEDCYSNAWNNITTANNLCQSKNTQCHSKMEVCTNENNSVYQFTRNTFEEQNTFNGTEPCFKYYRNFNENIVEHDLNNSFVNSFAQSESISSIANTFNSYVTNITDN